MQTKKLITGDSIGIVCPSHVASKERYQKIIPTLESLGFNVKLGNNVYKDTYGYLASEQERADDFNNMIADKNVKMILFGGGEGGNELLPYLDYDNIKKHPKIICGFSDGTTILNSIYALTGLTTYYGQGPGMFFDLRHYDYSQFCAHFVDDNASDFTANSPWQTLFPGVCKGKLI